MLIDGVSISFIRILRISEDGLSALPPGFAPFPLRPVDVDDARLPDHIRQRGGVMLPIYDHEAMWLSVSASSPAVLQVGSGGTCAVNGGELTEELSRDPQNYVVIPKQPWLDAFKTADGEVRQFVAVALGSGLTVENQLTGSESVGGLQLQVRRLTPEALKLHLDIRPLFEADCCSVASFDFMVDVPLKCESTSEPMGLGAGGRIDQEIFRDDFAATDWESVPLGKVWVHLVSAGDWQQFTGEPVLESPISVDDYVQAGLPWFDYVNTTGVDVGATPEMLGIKSIGELSGTYDHAPIVSPDDPLVQVIGIRQDGLVSTGSWTWTGRSS